MLSLLLTGCYCKAAGLAVTTYLDRLSGMTRILVQNNSQQRKKINLPTWDKCKSVHEHQHVVVGYPPWKLRCNYTTKTMNHTHSRFIDVDLDIIHVRVEMVITATIISYMKRHRETLWRKHSAKVPENIIRAITFQKRCTNNLTRR